MLLDIYYHLVPLLLAIASVFITERCGVVNISVEGEIILGSYLFYYFWNTTGSIFLSLLASAIVLLICGMLKALLILIYKLDHAVTTVCIASICFGMVGTLNNRFVLDVKDELILDKDTTGLILFIFISFLMYYLNYSKIVEYLSLVGDNFEECCRKGISPNIVRFYGLISSSMLAVVAGAYLIIVSNNNFHLNLFGGGGFLAIAFVSLGCWNYLSSCAYATVMLVFQYVLSDTIVGMDFYKENLVAISSYLLLILIALFRRKSRGHPKNLGMNH